MSENFIVNANDNYKRVQYLIKELIKDKTELVISCATHGAPLAARCAENLVRLNYVTYADIKTETSVIGNKRRTRFMIKLTKTDQFQKLYDENLEKRKEFQEERNKNTNTKAAPLSTTSTTK